MPGQVLVWFRLCSCQLLVGFGKVHFFSSCETLVCMYYSISNIWQWVCNPGKEVRSAIHNGLKHHSGQVLKHPFANKAALTIRSPSLNFEQRIKAREILWPLYLSECLFIRIRCSILSALVHTYIKYSSSDILVSQKKWAKPRTGWFKACVYLWTILYSKASSWGLPDNEILKFFIYLSGQR